MHGGNPIIELLLIVFGKVLLVLGLLLLVLFFLVLDLLVGGILLALLRRKRYLFWLLPPLNFGTWILLVPALSHWLWNDDITIAEQFRFPMANLTIMAAPCLALLGWLAAGVLAPVQLLLRSLWKPLPDEALDETYLDEYLAGPPAPPRWPAFREGFAAPWTGFGYLCRHPRLWRYALTPILLNLLISGLALVLFLSAVIWFATTLHPQFPPGWGWLVLEIICGIVLLLLALALTWAVWMLLQAILCGHFHGKLARQVEIQLGAKPEELTDIPFAWQVADAFIDLAVLAGINLGFLALHVIPVLGSIVGVIGSLYFDCYVFGAEYFDFPLSLRGRRRSERRDFTRRFRWQTLGQGAVVLFVNFIPLIGAVALTTVVVGAVLLHRRLAGDCREPRIET